MRALSAAPLGVPGKALWLGWPEGYQARLRRPGNAVPNKTTHPLNIIDFTGRPFHQRCSQQNGQNLALVPVCAAAAWA